MRKIIYAGIVVLLLILGITIAQVSTEPYTLAETTLGVPTSIGAQTLPAGTRIGANPSNFITIIQETALLTVEEGLLTFPSGTKIDCDHEIGEPDPCDPD